MILPILCRGGGRGQTGADDAQRRQRFFYNKYVLYAKTMSV